MENFGPQIEKKKERVPTSEEVFIVLEKLTNRKEVHELRKINDDDDLYLWEIKIDGDREGKHIEYLYRRRGSKEAGDDGPTAIHITYFEDDFPVSGTTAANYDEKKRSWKVID